MGLPKNIITGKTAAIPGVARGMDRLPDVPKKRKASKYRNRLTVVDGHRFASAVEAQRYGELKLLEAGGKIERLTLQPRYTVLDGFTAADGTQVRPVVYVGDFSYWEMGHEVCEDVKGLRTQVFEIKRKLFLATFPHVELRIIK